LINIGLLLSPRQPIREGVLLLLTTYFSTTLPSHLNSIQDLSWEIHRESDDEDEGKILVMRSNMSSEPACARLIDLITSPDFMETSLKQHAYSLQFHQLLLFLVAGGEWSFVMRKILSLRELVVWVSETLLGEASPANGKLYVKSSRFRLIFDLFSI